MTKSEHQLRRELKQLIGLSEDEFIKQAQAIGWTVRPSFRDGEVYYGSCEVNESRLNYGVIEGKVVSTTIG